MRTDPSPIAIGFALLLLAGLPLLAAIDARRGADLVGAAVHRRALYLSIAMSLLVVALLTLGIAAWQDVPAEELGWIVEDVRGALLWAIGVTAAGLGIVWAITLGVRVAELEESPVARLLMPRDAAEKRGFLLLSGAAAVCEEYIFRGFALGVVWSWTGSPWWAAAIVSLSFGLAHGYQRLAGILRAGTLGLLLAAPTIWTGSLFPAIVGHFWINAAIGLGGWRYLLGEGDGSDPGTAESAAREDDEGEEGKTG